jgi:hypothetical protein
MIDRAVRDSLVDPIKREPWSNGRFVWYEGSVPTGDVCSLIRNRFAQLVAIENMRRAQASWAPSPTNADLVRRASLVKRYPTAGTSFEQPQDGLGT